MSERLKCDYEVQFRKSLYIKIAKELHYPESVIAKLKESKNDIEATRIMTTERKKEKYDIYGSSNRKPWKTVRGGNGKT